MTTDGCPGQIPEGSMAADAPDQAESLARPRRRRVFNTLDPHGCASADEIRASSCASECSAGRSASRMASSRGPPWWGSAGPRNVRARPLGSRRGRILGSPGVHSNPRRDVPIPGVAARRDRGGAAPHPGPNSASWPVDNSLNAAFCRPSKGSRSPCWSRSRLLGSQLPARSPRPRSCGLPRRASPPAVGRPFNERTGGVPRSLLLHTCGWVCGKHRARFDDACRDHRERPLGLRRRRTARAAGRRDLEHVVS